MGKERLRELLKRHHAAEVVPKPRHCASSQPGGAITELFEALKPGIKLRHVPDQHLPALFAAWKTGRLELRTKKDPNQQRRARLGQLEADLSQRVQRLMQQDLFSALSLTPVADRAQVETAYARISDQWSEAKFADQPRRIRELVRRLRARLEVAREVLGDDNRRALYAEKLASRYMSTGRDDFTMTRLACVEADFGRAEQCVEEGRFAEAIPVLEQLIESDASEAEYRALYGWSIFAESPGSEDSLNRAVDQLRKALDLDTASPVAAYYLGRIYRQTGKPKLARRHFRLALERDPRYAAADRELRRLISLEAS